MGKVTTAEQDAIIYRAVFGQCPEGSIISKNVTTFKLSDMDVTMTRNIPDAAHSIDVDVVISNIEPLNNFKIRLVTMREISYEKMSDVQRRDEPDKKKTRKTKG